MTGCYFLANTLIPISDVITLESIMPIFTVFLGFLVLGEKISKSDIICAFIGLLGVLFIAKPDFLK